IEREIPAHSASQEKVRRARESRRFGGVKLAMMWAPRGAVFRFCRQMHCVGSERDAQGARGALGSQAGFPPLGGWAKRETDYDCEHDYDYDRTDPHPPQHSRETWCRLSLASGYQAHVEYAVASCSASSVRHSASNTQRTLPLPARW